MSVADGRILERVALALNSSLSLREVLRALVEVTREVTAAQRVSVFTWEDGVLVPAVSIGDEPDEALWAAFREMGPVELTEVQRSALASRRAIGISDAASDSLVPQRWVERFGLGSLAVVSLHAVDEPFGLLAVEYADRREFAPGELGVLEAIGDFAGVAARKARLYEQAQRSAELQASVARAATELARDEDPTATAGALAAAFDELAGERGSSVWRLERDGGRLVRLSPVLAAGPGTVELASLPDDVARRLPLSGHAELRIVDSAEVAPLSVGEGHRLLVPLPAEGRVVGLVVVRADTLRAGDREAREAALVLAALGAAALERHDLLALRSHQLRQLEVLFELTATLVERGDADALCERLSELLAPEGYEVTGLAFRQRDLARHLGGWESGAWTEDTVEVPLRLGERVVGTLRVRPPSPPPPAWEAFLEALGAGVAQLAARSALRGSLEQAHRERALSQERERIAAEVHETVGAVLEAIDGRLRRLGEDLPSDLPARRQVLGLAGLADGAKWHLEQAIRALAFVPTAHRGLAGALHSLAGQVQADSGIAVSVDVTGRVARLPGRVERALYRLASEALAAAWRYARCSVVSLELSFEPSEVVLRVRDDGVGLAQRQEQAVPASSLHALRRAVADVGGQMEFRPAAPHGLDLEVRVPRGRR